MMEIVVNFELRQVWVLLSSICLHETDRDLRLLHLLDRKKNAKDNDNNDEEEKNGTE